MSQANIEVVLRLVDAVNAGDIPRELIAPDFELRNVITNRVVGRWSSSGAWDALPAVGLQE